MGIRRKGKQRPGRGHHGAVKLRGSQTWRRDVYDVHGNCESIVIRVPEGHDATVFGFSVTPGFRPPNSKGTDDA